MQKHQCPHLRDQSEASVQAVRAAWGRNSPYGGLAELGVLEEQAGTGRGARGGEREGGWGGRVPDAGREDLPPPPPQAGDVNISSGQAAAHAHSVT